MSSVSISYEECIEIDQTLSVYDEDGNQVALADWDSCSEDISATVDGYVISKDEKDEYEKLKEEQEERGQDQVTWVYVHLNKHSENEEDHIKLVLRPIKQEKTDTYFNVDVWIEDQHDLKLLYKYLLNKVVDQLYENKSPIYQLYENKSPIVDHKESKHPQHNIGIQDTTMKVETTEMHTITENGQPITQEGESA